MSVTSDKKLWLFGDSFIAEQPQGTPTEILQKQWFNRVGMLLHSDIYNTGVNGSSLEYLITQLIQYKDLMNPGDYAIFTVTEPQRKWFIEERPDWGNLFMYGGYKEYPVKKVVQAIDDYKYHLANKAGHLSLYYGAIGLINHICLYHKIKYCILPSFSPPITVEYAEFDKFDLAFSEKKTQNDIDHKVKEIPAMGQMLDVWGNLTQISTEEFGDGDEDGDAKDVWQDIMQNKWRGCDQRLNHMTEVNHEFLAKKVYNCLIMGHGVDLTTGFHKSVINKDNFRDINPDNIYNHEYCMKDIDEEVAYKKKYNTKFKLF